MHEEEESHEMELRGVDAAGMEEWYCPTCGRHFMMRWPPDYSRRIIAAGDENVAHVGGKGGLIMGGATLASPDAAPAPEPPDSTPPLSSHVEGLLRKAIARIKREGDGERG